MARFAIRFNKTRGNPGRGTPEHVWRVFDGPREYLAKNININVPCWGCKTGEDWSICCDGTIRIEKDTSTIIIEAMI